MHVNVPHNVDMTTVVINDVIRRKLTSGGAEDRAEDRPENSGKTLDFFKVMHIVVSYSSTMPC